jgi:single-strand DNA-binding protein
MINKVILLGRLGKDPVVRRLENGRVVANVTLATNDYYTKDGQRLESTEWHNLEMWDKQAETAEKYLKKGSLLYVEGKIRTDKYTDAEGQERQARKIRVANFQMMSSMLSARTEDGGNRDHSRESHTSEPSSNDGTNAMDMGHDDELPF